MDINRKSLYNPLSNESVSERKIFGGEPTCIFDLNKIKYQWAYKLWNIMLANTWFPGEVNMSNDCKDYQFNLSPSERGCYDKALAQLIFMDSLQTNNIIDNLNPYITSPEINLILVRQAFEEALHSQSYAVMVESISTNTDTIYNMWRVDNQLKNKNDYIANVYINLSKQPSEEALLKCFFANQILEGIYFYSGFAYFYTLARSGKMLASSQMIRFIQRDEVTHLLIFENIIKTLKSERPDLFTSHLHDEVVAMFRSAVDLESSWGSYITSNSILGLTPELIKSYIEYLANKRLKAVGYSRIYQVSKNPLPWMDTFSNFNIHKTNFFESKVTNYSKGSINFDNL